jgi:hypothetical protein
MSTTFTCAACLREIQTDDDGRLFYSPQEAALIRHTRCRSGSPTEVSLQNARIAPATTLRNAIRAGADVTELLNQIASTEG